VIDVTPFSVSEESVDGSIPIGFPFDAHTNDETNVLLALQWYLRVASDIS
jgi:hypothetical protein